MSKTSKFFRTPGLFFSDMLKKKIGVPTSGQVNATATATAAAAARKPAPKAAAPAAKVAPAAAKPIQFKTLPLYMAEITNFASSFNVNTLKVGDEPFWPYLRSHLVCQYIALNARRDPRGSQLLKPSRVSMGSSAELPYSLRSLFASKYGVQELEQVEETEGVDFLFFTFTNATEQVELEDKYFYRVTDTVYECAKTVGSARKVEIIRSNSQGIRKALSYYHKPLLVFSPSLYQQGYRHRLDFHRDFFPTAIRYLPSVTLTLEGLESVVDWEMSTREFYINLFKRLKPRVVFVPAFHMCPPLISAARSLGILTVDIQHGIQVGWNPLYNDWNEAPSAGYPALPDYFMVWSKKEAENIRKIFPWAKPLIIGHTWLARQLKFGAGLPRSVQHDLERPGPKVLVAMQLSTEIPQWLIDVITAAPAEFTFMIRNHPKALKKFGADAFKDYPTMAKVICSEELDAALLVPILKETDAVISEGSSVSAEAELFGASVFLCGETAKNNYAEEVASGAYNVYSDPQNFFDVILADAESGGSKKEGGVERSLEYTTESLNLLLESSKKFGAK